MTKPNQKTVNVKMKRIELCDLLLAASALAQELGKESKWGKLHEMLRAQLEEYDAKQESGLIIGAKPQAPGVCPGGCLQNYADPLPHCGTCVHRGGEVQDET